MGKMIAVRVDDKLKADFEDFCKNVGSNTSVMLNMFMRNVTKEKRLPFDVKYYDGDKKEKQVDNKS
ncbi:MAG: type II toxin-antitoxin system RelB/DinJ family antitoxin [Clostridiales bacterium]|jgi:DNA-damage-inducible protein J|nr:type II toxin-antitoxin system RelB/DinJ family antitoxin [Clostridiales bacterium]